MEDKNTCGYCKLSKNHGTKCPYNRGGKCKEYDKSYANIVEDNYNLICKKYRCIFKGDIAQFIYCGICMGFTNEQFDCIINPYMVYNNSTKPRFIFNSFLDGKSIDYVNNFMDNYDEYQLNIICQGLYKYKLDIKDAMIYSNPKISNGNMETILKMIVYYRNKIPKQYLYELFNNSEIAIDNKRIGIVCKYLNNINITSDSKYIFGNRDDNLEFIKKYYMDIRFSNDELNIILRAYNKYPKEYIDIIANPDLYEEQIKLIDQYLKSIFYCLDLYNKNKESKDCKEPSVAIPTLEEVKEIIDKYVDLNNSIAEQIKLVDRDIKYFKYDI